MGIQRRELLPSLRQTSTSLNAERQRRAARRWQVTRVPARPQAGPTAQMAQNSTAVRISIDLPGVQVSDMRVRIRSGKMVIICGRRVYNMEGTRCLRRDYKIHTFLFPSKLVDFDTLRASLSHGVLTLLASKVAVERVDDTNEDVVVAVSTDSLYPAASATV